MQNPPYDVNKRYYNIYIGNSISVQSIPIIDREA